MKLQPAAKFEISFDFRELATELLKLTKSASMCIKKRKNGKIWKKKKDKFFFGDISLTDF